ncbi:hypothetical protein PIB30_094110 [Stylosanthes scabra]|uniref:2-oxo-4-hydroxy-4-carboxy-5-ureidoimidazoline decarboxylase n=1 Tax=Stylosanthes scabra TaxID=79078 RepID=A0ABU6VWA8_9FABA|nr:hypothetical protein [Stylosanthes scabra]
MVSASPFVSLDHAITIARDIFLNELDVSCWVEALSSRDCFDQYLEDELYEWGSKYEEKFGYGFFTFPYEKTSGEILTELKTRYRNSQLVELDIASKEEINIVETKLDGFYVLWHQNTESAEDHLSGVITETRGNLRENTSFGTNVARRFETTHSQEKESVVVDRRHVTDESNISHRNFDLNKKSWYGHDISDSLKHDNARFITEFFSPGEYDTSEYN